MIKKSKIKGFDYYLSDEVIRSYREKPIELRLKWLYMGNLLRKAYDKKIIEIQDKYRAGKM